MKLKYQRLLLILLVLMGLGGAAFFILSAFQEALIFYYIPSDLPQKKMNSQQRIRVGGLVKPQSVHSAGEKVSFEITDQKNSLKVNYQGTLPDLFREGQTAVAEGYLLEPNLFQADSILAKHDEKYMPKEVADALKKKALWKDSQ